MRGDPARLADEERPHSAPISYQRLGLLAAVPSDLMRWAKADCAGVITRQSPTPRPFDLSCPFEALMDRHMKIVTTQPYRHLQLLPYFGRARTIMDRAESRTNRGRVSFRSWAPARAAVLSNEIAKTIVERRAP